MGGGFRGGSVRLIAAVVIAALGPGAAAVPAQAVAATVACPTVPTAVTPVSRLGLVPGAEGARPAGWVESRHRTWDVDGDGQADLVAFDAAGATVRWATGTLSVPGATVDTLVLAEVTGDGVADLATVADGKVRVQPGPLPDRRPVLAAPLDPSIAAGPVRLRDSWDLDGDGVADLAAQQVAERGSGPVQRFRASGCPAGLWLGGRAAGRAADTGTPSVTPGLDVADPDIVRDGDRFYVYATNTFIPFGWANVPVRQSVDLAHWEAPVDALPSLPAWATPGTGHVWAPSVRQMGPTWVMLYAAMGKPGTGSIAGHMCIGRAQAGSPQGPFVDASAQPFFCRPGLGGDIDPELLVDGNGVTRMLVKNDGNSIGAPSTLWSVELSSDATFTIGPPVALLSRDQAWEQPTIEAPTMVRNGGVDWLFYSGGSYADGSYAIGNGFCSSPAGPCIKTSVGAPWKGSDPYALGPGGQDVLVDVAGNTWLAYHGWYDGRDAADGGVRSLFIQRLRFDPSGPHLDATTPFTEALGYPSVAPSAVGASGLPHGCSVWWSDAPGDVPVTGYEVTVVELPAATLHITRFPADGPHQWSIGGMADGATCAVAVRAAGPNGRLGPASPLTVATTGTPALRYTPIVPARALDTRDGTGVVGHVAFPLAPRTALTLDLTAVAGLPPAAQMGAVALNLTVTGVVPGVGEESHLRVWPADVGVPPDASVLNFRAGETRAASTVVRTSPDGKIRIYNNAGWTNVVADVVGYYAVGPGGGHHAVAPVRIVDTRDGTGAPAGPVAGGASIRVDAAGVGGLPAAGAFSAVVVNLTVANSTTVTHLRAWSGVPATAPPTSVVNTDPGRDAANLAVVPVAPDGSFRIFNNSGSAHVIADLVGWFGPVNGVDGAAFVPLPPGRFLDTRPAATLGPGGVATATPDIAGYLAGAEASAVTGTITVDQPSTATHLTLWPDDAAAPGTSNVNTTAGRTRANGFDVHVAAGSTLPGAGTAAVTVRNQQGTAHALLDLSGYYLTESAG